MINRYMNRLHISEAKLREIIRLFSVDIEATKISQITKISRQTINAILYKVRQRIVQVAEKESYFTQGEIEIDESYFGAKRARGKRGRGSYGKTKVFGMKKREDKVYTQMAGIEYEITILPVTIGGEYRYLKINETGGKGSDKTNYHTNIFMLKARYSF